MKKLGVIILIASIPIVLIAVFAVDWHFPKIGEEARKANKYDLLFFNTAVANNEISFCEAIYSEAYLAAAWGRNGQEVTYTKSECYRAIAVNTRNTSFCSNVQPVNTWFLNGSKMNPQSCVEEAQSFVSSGSSSTPYGTTFIVFADLDSLFYSLGYANDMIPQSYWDEYGPDREPVIRTYLDDIATTDDFKMRVTKMRPIPIKFLE